LTEAGVTSEADQDFYLNKGAKAIENAVQRAMQKDDMHNMGYNNGYNQMNKMQMMFNEEFEEMPTDEKL